VAEGVRERHLAFYDASGGRTDAAALAIAHAAKDAAVLDLVRAWPAPHDPAAVIREASEVLRRYGLRAVVGDRYAGAFVEEQFRAHGVTYRASERDRSAIYLAFLPLVQAGRAVLLDAPELLRELRGLERRRGAAGRDRVDHAPGAHDDRAAAGAVTLAGVGRHCTSPSCFDATCDGRGPLLLFTDEWAQWKARHPDATEFAELERRLDMGELPALQREVERLEPAVGCYLAVPGASGWRWYSLWPLVGVCDFILVWAALDALMASDTPSALR
jgi:hypothetical protein